MIVQIKVKKHGFVPPPETVAVQGDWRTIVCMIDLLRPAGEGTGYKPTPSGYQRICKRTYAWSVQEWDGAR